MIPLFCSAVNSFKVLSYFGVPVKAVHHIKIMCKTGSPNGQIVRRAAADKQNIYVIFEIEKPVGRKNRNICFGTDLIFLPARKNTDYPSVLSPHKRPQNSPAEVAEPYNCRTHNKKNLRMNI